MTIDGEPGEFEPGLPDAVRSVLKDRYGLVPEVSPEIDQAILAEARQHLSTIVPPARKHRRWSSWRWTALVSTIVTASIMCLALRTPLSEPDRKTSEDVSTPPPMMMRAVGKEVRGDEAGEKAIDQDVKEAK